MISQEFIYWIWRVFKFTFSYLLKTIIYTNHYLGINLGCLSQVEKEKIGNRAITIKHDELRQVNNLIDIAKIYVYFNALKMQFIVFRSG